MVAIEVNGKQFKRALSNIIALTIPSNTIEPIPPSDTVRFSIDPETPGVLTITRSSKYVAAEHTVPIVAGVVKDYEDVTITAKQERKSGYVDDLVTLKTAITAPMTTKTNNLTITVSLDKPLTVMNGTELVGELAPLDDERLDYRYDAIADLLDAPVKDPDPLTLFNVATLARFQSVRTEEFGTMAPNITLAKVSGRDVALYRIGKDIRGAVALINQHIFTAGGPWKDGPGDADHLPDQADAGYLF
jgi:hypothetical protein